MIKDRIQQLDGQLSGDAVSIEEAGKQAETAKEQYAVLESLRDVNTALTETKHLIEEVRQKYGKLAAKKTGGRTDRNFAAHQNAGTVGSV